MSDIDLTEAVEAATDAVLKGWNEHRPDASRKSRDAVTAAAPLIEAAVREKVAAEIRAVAADPERTRPIRKDAEVATDYANDFEWAAMVAENGSSS